MSNNRVIGVPFVICPHCDLPHDPEYAATMRCAVGRLREAWAVFTATVASKLTR